MSTVPSTSHRREKTWKILLFTILTFFLAHAAIWWVPDSVNTDLVIILYACLQAALMLIFNVDYIPAVLLSLGIFATDFRFYIQQKNQGLLNLLAPPQLALYVTLVILFVALSLAALVRWFIRKKIAEKDKNPESVKIEIKYNLNRDNQGKYE